MDKVHVIRHKVLIEGASIRQVSREMHVSRKTIRKYLKQPEPRRVESGPRARPVFETVAEHMPPEAQAYLMRDPQWCLQKAEKIGLMCLELVDQLFASRTLDNLRAAQGVLQLHKKYGATRLEAACRRAVEHGTPLYRAVKIILEKGLDMESKEQRPSLLSETYKGRGRFCRDTREMLQ